MKRRVFALLLSVVLCFGLATVAFADTELTDDGKLEWTNPNPPLPGTTDPDTPDTPDTPNPPSSGGNDYVPVTPTKPAEPSHEDTNVTGNVDWNKTVADATKNESPNVNVKADGPTVNIPASAAAKLASDTDANLNVSTPLADVSLTNDALAQLAGNGTGTVTVAVTKDGDTTTVALRKDGVDAAGLSGVTAAIPADKSGSGVVAIVVNPDGTRKILKKSVVEDGAVEVSLTGTTSIQVADNSKSFGDTAGHWGADAISFTTSRELFQGVGDGSQFAPDLPMNRAMLVTVLHRLEDEPASTALGTQFPDVASGTWYTEAVTWASDQKIVEGGDSGFAPDTNITREQLATMLYRYAKTLGMDTSLSGDLSSYQDGATVSTWAADAMRWAVGHGIIRGADGNNLLPGGNATRAQVATILQRLVEMM